ncbi:hypothetical protein [Streptomyces sp. AK02-04a]|uniref:hypothetical protein n=1 Tax=Streptomyces sp. AK02-04a TaxID=3028649 RepID=UPI0029B0F312|nr:hypothetical protein [Streptomyces sp. AK02-04a]MDX3762278.1 hypothetical protein [Streptomyces sp. AK02-04a]
MMDGAAYDLWPRVIVNTVLFALFAFSFFRPSSKRDWRAMGAQYWCRTAPRSADVGRLLGDVTQRRSHTRQGCSSVLTPQAAGDTVPPAA